MPTTNLPSSNLNRAHWLNLHSHIRYLLLRVVSPIIQPKHPLEQQDHKLLLTPTTLTCSSAPFYWDQLKVIWNCRKMKQIKFSTKMNKFKYTWYNIVRHFLIKLCYIFIWLCCACKAGGWLVSILSAYNEDIWFLTTLGKILTNNKAFIELGSYNYVQTERSIFKYTFFYKNNFIRTTRLRFG